MKTEAATALQQHILDEASRLSDMARMYAVQYADSDDQADKSNYLRYKFAADELRKLHGPACQFLHALEAEIPTEPNP